MALIPCPQCNHTISDKANACVKNYEKIYGKYWKGVIICPKKEDKEAYYHSIIYLILTLMGVRVSAEVHTNKGRIDAVIKTEHHVYIIILIGVGFDVEEKNIKDYLIKPIQV